MTTLGIVEDVAEMRSLLRTCLGAQGELRVLWDAGSVPEARLELGRRRPDWVLLDEILPGISGLDFLPELAAQEVPVILLTGVQREAPLPPGARARLLKPGADGRDRDRTRFVDELIRMIRA